MAMNVSPIEDLASGYWVTGLLYQKIDEITPDSSDYIISAARPQYDSSSVRLSGFLNPPTGRENLLIKSQYQKWPSSTEPLDLSVSLYDGQNYIYQGTVPNIGTGWVTGGMYVPRDNAEHISGFNDLRLGFCAISNSLNSGLISYWKLDETGSTRIDSYGTNNLISNNQVSYETGRMDFGAYFVSGTGQYLSVASNATLQFGSGNDFTLAGWVNLKNPNPNNSNSTVIASKVGPNSNIEEYCLLYNDKLGFGFGLGSGNIRNVTYSNNTYNTGTGNWFFAIGQHDSANHRQWIRINSTSDINSGSSVGFGISDTGTFIIGQDIKSGTTQHTGIIDEISIWNRLLTSGEIERLYNSRQGSTGPFSGSTLNNGLVGYWPLNETGNIKKDLIGGNHLTHVGYIGTGTGLFGQSTFYIPDRSVTGYLSGINVDSPREYGNGSFSVAAWDYSTDFFSNRSIVSKGNNSSGWAIQTLNNGKSFFVINGQSTNQNIFPKSGAWNFRALSCDNSKPLSSRVTLCTNNTIGTTSATHLKPGLDQNLTVGIRINSIPPVPFFYSGQIADVAYWNRALTTAEMNELYNRGAGRTYPFNKNSLCDDLVAYWKLDETSGTRYASVGTGDLADVDTVGSVTGKRGNCAYFSGQGNQSLMLLDATQMRLPESGDYTIGFWHYMHTTGTENGFALFGAGGFNKNNLRQSSFANTLNYVTTKSDGGFISNPTLTSFNTGQWYFSCIGRDTANEVIFYFVNGQPNHNVHVTGKLKQDNEFWIGDSANSNQPFSGYIDEFGYWKRKLSSDEIAYLYNNGAGRTYPFV